jgi:hypothetical protein
MLREHVARLLHDRLGLEIHRVAPPAPPDPEPPSGADHSLFSEESIARRLLQGVQAPEWVVDIGASDGRTESNSFGLLRAGWSGLTVELDAAKFVALARLHEPRPQVRLARARVTPHNVVGLLQGAEVPRDFAFLTLDIDGYDHWVLDAVLAAYRPALICTEINEKIPPPLRFSVRYSDDYAWGTDHFYGQSIAQLGTLLQRHDYALVQLEYNNAFLMPAEQAPQSLSPAEAYRTGYADRPDRREKMPWNADMEPLQTMTPADAAAALHERFAAYAGQYDLDWS